LAGVRLIILTSVCFMTEPSKMCCLLTMVLKQVFYMASILRSLHIPAVNGNQRRRKNKEINHLNFTELTVYCVQILVTHSVQFIIEEWTILTI
jgi:hypothetical protein